MFISCANICHGTISEWCSISVSMIASPSERLALPQAWATKLIASVVPLVMIALLALNLDFSAVRHDSYPSVASPARV